MFRVNISLHLSLWLFSLSSNLGSTPSLSLNFHCHTRGHILLHHPWPSTSLLTCTRALISSLSICLAQLRHHYLQCKFLIKDLVWRKEPCTSHRHIFLGSQKDFIIWPQFACLTSPLASFSSAKLPAFLSKHLVHVLCACAETSAKNCPFLYCLAQEYLLVLQDPNQMSCPPRSLIS